MESLMHLCEDYTMFLEQSKIQKSQNKMLEFKMFLQNLNNISSNPLPNLKYISAHASYLLNLIANPSKLQRVPFSIIIQILNVLLQNQFDLAVKIPSNLMSALALQISQNPSYLHSPIMISKIIWLIGRCIQMSADRFHHMVALSQSRLLQTFLHCPRLEPIAQKGIVLLLGYLCKCQLIKKQVSLNIIQNIQKLNYLDSIRQIFAILRKLGLSEVKNNKSLMEILGKTLILYMNNQSIPQNEKMLNWELAVSVAHTHIHFIDQLQIHKILKMKLQETTLTIQEQPLNQIFQLAQILIKNTHQSAAYLKLAIKNIFSNPISRRIFIQHHEKMTPQLFIELVSGPLATKMAQQLQNLDQRNNLLKLLICIKRSASILGMDTFYDYKFNQVSILVNQLIMDKNFPQQLLDLWSDVSFMEEE